MQDQGYKNHTFVQFWMGFLSS